MAVIMNYVMMSEMFMSK